MNTTTNTARSFLESIGACEGAMRWIGDRSLQQAWDDCEHGGWMLWLLRRMVGTEGWPSLQVVVGLCCDCAELAKEQWVGDAPRVAISTARAWIRGEATIEEVRAAALAAAATYAAAAALAAAATYAAAAATYATYAAAAATYAAEAADDAAYTAAAANYTAADADAAADAATAAATYAAEAADDAYDATLKRCAEIVRAAVPTLPQIGYTAS